MSDDIYSGMTVKELKEQLRDKRLRVSGNKPELLARLRAGSSAIRRKSSRKSRKSRNKGVRKSRNKGVRKSRKKPVKRKPSIKKARVKNWFDQSKVEIKNNLKSMKVTEIRKSPQLKPYLKGKSKAKKQELIDHLTIMLSTKSPPPLSKAKKKASRKARKASKKVKKKASRKARKASKKVKRKASKKVKRKASSPLNWGLKLVKKFSRNSVRKYPDRLFIFGENDACFDTGEEWRKNGDIDENDECYQTTTQAVIRGEPNAAPIITISKNGVSDNEIKKLMERDVNKIVKDLRSGKYKDVILSSNLIGTGVAKLDKNNLDLWKYLQQQLARLKPKSTVPQPELGVNKTIFAMWLLDKVPKRKPSKVSRKSKLTQPSIESPIISEEEEITTTPILPVPQDSNAEIEKAIRKCLYGDSNVLPVQEASPEPEIVDDEEDEEELEIED